MNVHQFADMLGTPQLFPGMTTRIGLLKQCQAELRVQEAYRDSVNISIAALKQQEALLASPSADEVVSEVMHDIAVTAFSPELQENAIRIAEMRERLDALMRDAEERDFGRPALVAPPVVQPTATPVPVTDFVALKEYLLSVYSGHADRVAAALFPNAQAVVYDPATWPRHASRMSGASHADTVVLFPNGFLLVRAGDLPILGWGKVDLGSLQWIVPPPRLGEIMEVPKGAVLLERMYYLHTHVLTGTGLGASDDIKYKAFLRQLPVQ